MAKGCTSRICQFGLGSKSLVYSPIPQWVSNKALVNFQLVASLEAVAFSFLNIQL